MTLKTVPPYPVDPPSAGSIVFTQCDNLYHRSEIAKNRVDQGLKIGNDLFGSYESKEQMFHAMRLILSDSPLEELLTSVSAGQKGSVLSLCTLGFAINQKVDGDRAISIARSGKGVIILRLNSDLHSSMYELELFDDWNSYMQYVRPLIDGRDGIIVKGSTIV